VGEVVRHAVLDFDEFGDAGGLLGRSTGTVGEHLRNAEVKPMAALFGDHKPARPRPLESRRY
jgi:hypothetical protein